MRHCRSWSCVVSAVVLPLIALCPHGGAAVAGEGLVTLAQAHSADAAPGQVAAATEGMGLVLRASAAAEGAGPKAAPGTLAALAAIADVGPKCVDAAAKQKCAGLVACVTETSAPQFEAAARKAKLPLIEVGGVGTTRTLDPADPVFRVEPSIAEWALAVIETLRLRSAKASVGVPAAIRRAWIVFDDSEWARLVAESMLANDVSGVLAPKGTLRVTTVRAGAAAMSADACDCVVVLGAASTLQSVSQALESASMRVPVVALDLALDAGAPRRNTIYVGLTPSWAASRNADDVYARHGPVDGSPALIPPIARGFVAATALLEAATTTSKKGVVGALRELREGTGGRQRELFDDTGCVDGWVRSLWTAAPDGALVRIKPEFLPDAALGPLLGGAPGSRYHAAPGTTCVRVGFGGTAGAPTRTIDDDLATIGLRTAAGGTRADELVRAEILARTCGKLSRVWLRSYDGSARAALSYRISFVPEGAATDGASAVWEATVAGDGPEGKHGGESFPGKARCTAFSTYLLRRAAPLQAARLTPPLAESDIPYLDGSYAWNTSAEGNRRSDGLRALIDGVASTFSMKLSKEIGHLAGLGIDNSGDPRSVMVTKGGEGTSDASAYFRPADTKILEKTLGRVPATGQR